jgi:endogenous inhibitor of DNA gyrase (YacG/DUF329 family)
MPPAEPPRDTPRDTTGDTGSGGPPKPCPICGKPAAKATRPFCSPRCRDVDLNRWLSGSYVVPAAEDDPEERE